MVRILLKMRGRGNYSETYGYAESLGVKTVGFRSNAPAGPIGIVVLGCVQNRCFFGKQVEFSRPSHEGGIIVPSISHLHCSLT